MKEAGFRPYAREWWHFELSNEPFNRHGFDFEVSASHLPDVSSRPASKATSR
jgi:D-alanyl-D-alanine dipeptidase